MQRTCRSALLVLCALTAVGPLFSQQRQDFRHTYERLWCVEPLGGKGTADDPVRPVHAPPPTSIHPDVRSGILGFAFVASDDGKLALVEFVAADPKVFEPIVADSNTKCFLRGRDSQSALEAEFLKHNKHFDFAKFGVRMP